MVFLYSGILVLFFKF